MANDAAIIAKMRRANVAVHAYRQSLETLGQKRLAAYVGSKHYDIGVSGYASILINSSAEGADRVSAICNVLAKELVLRGVQVRCISLSSLFRLATTDNWEPIEASILVVPSIGEELDHRPAKDWYDVQDLLLSHINRGAGVVLGNSGFIDAGRAGDELSDALTIFESFDVEGRK